ncbi:MAG: hypothetical protein DSY82_08295 [Flavobacteriia bacterium]|nr:MAG: hypothetical protein DSY82_08295 [Flavobacteriia bacterium]
MTKFQKITIILIIAYMIWEFIVHLWAASTHVDNMIRVDLVIIYPILIIMILISVYQYFKK